MESESGIASVHPVSVWFLSLGSRGFVSTGFAGLYLRKAMSSSESFSPTPLDLWICSSSPNCLSL
ncbi:hypothetical protein Bca52824_009971 [Brassica carinata]|uniref:Uncharacterized protein n=1 Tax=Brassica carinata TaxID=52824 RepID=A0A8X7WAR2_BRACI|nr:hypothetical protein Bca52824_009971 [Brassica carinata]